MHGRMGNSYEPAAVAVRILASIVCLISGIVVGGQLRWVLVLAAALPLLLLVFDFRRSRPPYR
jgi:hypothetical protein